MNKETKNNLDTASSNTDTALFVSQNDKTNKSVASEVYEGTASFGIFIALIGAIIGSILGIILLVIGIRIISTKTTKTQINATITKINGVGNLLSNENRSQLTPDNSRCPSVSQGMHSCFIEVSYKYLDKEYKKDINYTGDKSYYIGQNINVYIEPSDPNNVQLNSPPSNTTGIILIVVGLLIILGGWIWYWISKKWKVAAAATGASGIWNIISN